MERHASVTPTSSRKSARRESEGLWDWNLVSNRIHFSPGWVSLAGCQAHEISNTPDEWFQRVHPDDSAQLQRDIESARTPPACDFNLRYRLRHKDGTYRWMSSRGLVIRNDRGDAVRLTGAQTDVTVETVTDPVTGLPNGLLLLDRLAQSIARARRHSTFHFALVLIELGRPPGLNGATRPATDPLLNAAARRLETCLRNPETMTDQRQNDLVARIDGDRLAVLLDGLHDLTHSKAVADSILAEMLEPFSVNSREVRLSPAIGIALSGTLYQTADEALRDAETAVHRARVLGGSHCEVFDADVLKSAQSALHLEAELELALPRGEFELMYQPIVALDSNRVVGVEALTRWRHPTLGLISPLDFIPIAERTGLILPIGQWILQEACLQLRAWQASVPGSDDLWVSVNLSGVQMRSPGIADQIEEALRRADLEPRCLVLELTEGVAMDNPVAVTTILMRLRTMGIKIGIDDFGTGYSSLAYLRQFPVDALKVDQSFVRAITNKDTAAIVGSIVAMANELGLYVVAEGVEEPAQLEVLRSLGCSSAQGYLFAEPLDAATAGDFLQTGPSVDTAPPDDVPLDGTATRLLPWLPLSRPRPGARELLLAGTVLAVLASTGAGKVFHGNHPAQALADPFQSLLTSSDGGSSFGEFSGMPHPSVAGGRAQTPLRPPMTVPAFTPAPPFVLDTPSILFDAGGRPLPPATVESRRASFEVVHLHRMGKCRGQLIVTAVGVEFASSKDHGDAFVLRFGDFVQIADRDILTIRSANKAYRFTLVAGSSKDPARSPQDVVDAIVRSRFR